MHFLFTGTPGATPPPSYPAVAVCNDHKQETGEGRAKTLPLPRCILHRQQRRRFICNCALNDPPRFFKNVCAIFISYSQTERNSVEVFKKVSHFLFSADSRFPWISQQYFLNPQQALIYQ